MPPPVSFKTRDVNVSRARSGDKRSGSCDFREVKSYSLRLSARQRFMGVGCVGILWLLAACTEPLTSEEIVQAGRGAVQPSGEGALLREAEACGLLRDAHEETIARLDCSRPVPSCPVGVRPAGACSNYGYAAETVESCAELVRKYESCADFDRKPCIVTAVPVSGACDSNGAGGQGGDSGAP